MLAKHKMSDNFSGKRKRGGKRERGTPRGAGKKAPSEERMRKDEPLTREEYEIAKNRLLRLAVLAETQYTELRTQLRDNKLKELADYKESVKNRTCPEFLLGKEEADQVLAKKNDINLARYQLKMAQIQDEFEGETLMNETQFEDQFTYSRCRFIEFFQELIKEKNKRQRQVGMVLGGLLTLPPLPPPEIRKTPLVNEVQFHGRQTRSRSKTQRNEEGSSN